MLYQTRGVPSFAGRPIAPALCHSLPSTSSVKGRPEWPQITPSLPSPSRSSSRALDRKRVVSGESVAVSVDLGGRRTITKTKVDQYNTGENNNIKIRELK